MKNTKNILLVSAFILLLFSCKKDENYSTTDLLTRQPWILTASTYNPPVETPYGTVVDRYADMPDFYKDDLWVLNPSGTYSKNEGASKYSPNDVDVWEMGVWELSQDEQYFYTWFLFDYTEYKILNLSESEMQVSYLFMYDTISVHTITDTYRHP